MSYVEESIINRPVTDQPRLSGYPRGDGRKGIRNIVAVAYLVECAHHVAREIVAQFKPRFGDADFDVTNAHHAAPEVHLIGFPGCYPDRDAEKMMERVATHPNVGAVLFVSLGCESMDKYYLANVVRASGRPVEVLMIQEGGGTCSTIQQGVEWIQHVHELLRAQSTVPMRFDELIIGMACGGSSRTGSIAANRAVDRGFAMLIDEGAACMFDRTGGLSRYEYEMKSCEARPELVDAIIHCLAKATRYSRMVGCGSFAGCNAEGGLTTQEKKSPGACANRDALPDVGIIKPGDIPLAGGLYLLDVVPDGEPRFGLPKISDTAEIGELIACGCHAILSRTERAPVVGSAISPVVTVGAHPTTSRDPWGDMDVDAGHVSEGCGTLDEVGRGLFNLTVAVVNGTRSKSEMLEHREFIIRCNPFEPIGPACLPASVHDEILHEKSPGLMAAI